jgi:hypothetical protein
MDKYGVVVVDLEQLAALMAKALEDLECPDCCGPIHEFIEIGVRVYQEEHEWACFAHAVLHAQRAKRIGGGRR